MSAKEHFKNMLRRLRPQNNDFFQHEPSQSLLFLSAASYLHHHSSHHPDASADGRAGAYGPLQFVGDLLEDIIVPSHPLLWDIVA